MAKPGTRILSVLLASAAAAWCAWHFIPGTAVDRGLARLASKALAKPPVAIAGNGSHESPWIVFETSRSTSAPALDFPIVSLADDPEGIFQSSPPSPLDLAIVLKNMRRLGTTNAGIGAVLAWEQPDVIALSALDSALSSFGKIATAAPLSRGPTSSPLPPSFRRASIAPRQAQGNIADLPVVNRIPLPGIILGQDNALAGFTILENEPEGAPLAARWDDRIVFAFPVIAAVVKDGLTIDDIELVPGSHLRIGRNGPVVAIDRYGRMMSPPGKPVAETTANAASLADRADPLPADAHGFTLLRDDQSGAEPQTRRFSESVAPRIQSMAAGEAAPAARIFRRAPAASELTLLGAVSLAIAAAGMRSRVIRHRIYLLVGILALPLQFALAITASFWFVAIPILAAALVAFTVSVLFFRETTASIPKPQPAAPVIISEPAAVPVIPIAEPVAVAEPEPVPAKKAAAKKPARKAATKKAAVKKVTAKKAAPKKRAAKKSARPKKSPPADS